MDSVMRSDCKVINKTPRQWLLDQKIPDGKIDEVIESFEKPEEIEVCLFSAPREFYRFHPRHDDLSAENYHFKGIAAPNYWADGSAFTAAWRRAEIFEGSLEDQYIAMIAKQHYRDICAICHNWNALDDNKLWRLRLRGDERVEGLIGPTKPQPTHAAMPEEPASQSMLKGGALQAYLNPKTPFICTPVNW